MEKQGKETYVQWRDRVINSISPSFCGAKWGNATIWLESGTTASCHHPLAHSIPLEEVQRNYKAIHNTKHKKAARLDMLKGIRTKECDACWSIEKQGSHLISDRVFKSVIYTEDELQRFATEYRDEGDVTPKTLEISFSNLCQMSCMYCSQIYSTTWAADLSSNGTYLDLTTPGHQVFTRILKLSSAGTQPDGTNPYQEAFWKWWENGLAEHLKELRITGGEATMSPHFWRLLDWYDSNPGRGPKLAVNSNMMPVKHLLDKFISRSHAIKELEVYTSCEAVTEKAEYIRDGLNWDQWRENIDRLVSEGNVQQTHCMMTLSALSAFGATEFLDYLVRERRKRKNKYFLQASLNILRFPSFQSSYSISPALRNQLADTLQVWYDDTVSEKAPLADTNYTGSWLNEFERPSIERYIAHLRSSPPTDFDYAASRRDLVSFLNQYDERRKKNWLATFPELRVDLEEYL
jgi:hypothetical protein